MTGVMVIQGWKLSAEEIGLIQGLLAEYRDWGRTRLSGELCCRWDWRNAQSRIKDTRLVFDYLRMTKNSVTVPIRP